MQIKNIVQFFERIPRPFLTLFAFLLVLAIDDLDFITGFHISVAVLYLLPIILVAWFEGGVPASIISIFSAVTWAVGDLASGHMYSHTRTAVWNGVLVLGLFLIVSYFVTVVKKLSRERRSDV